VGLAAEKAQLQSVLCFELINDSVNFLFFVALRVLSSKLVVGKPRLVVLKLRLHGLEVDVQVVLDGVFVAEVQLHSRVDALLQVLLQFRLVVVEVRVEVR